MKNKKLSLILGVLVILVMLSPIVSARELSEHEKEIFEQMGFFSRLKYGMDKGLFFFSAWGQSNCCATDDSGYCETTGDYVGYDEEWTYGTERIDCDDYCSSDKCAIDTWEDRYCIQDGCSHSSSFSNWNDYIGEENGDGAYFVGDTSKQWYFSQIYCCPDSCPIEEHETKVYECEDGDWDSKGYYELDDYCSYAGSENDNQCWCADEDDNFYIDESGNVHCDDDPSNSWCTEIITTTCWQRTGSGTSETCSSYSSTSGCTGDFTSQQACLDSIEPEEYIKDCWEFVVSADECIEMPNVKLSPFTCIEIGKYTTKQACEDAREQACGNGICEAGETNTNCPADCGGPGIVCGNNECEAGESCSSCEVDCGSCDVNGGIGIAKTITWTEYYSMSDVKILSSICTSTLECPIKSGYTVTCDKSGDLQERLYDANAEKCEKAMPGGLLGFVPSIITKILIGKTPCEIGTNIGVWIQANFLNETPGICIAESDTWYGGLWEQSLKTVGGMGLPAQYVMVITIMLLITIIGMAMRMIR